MNSHFDAHGLGDSHPALTQGGARVRTMQEAEVFRSLIGEQNFEATCRALADGAKVWFFRTEEEIWKDPDLQDDEKKECLRILRDEGFGYAGWHRAPTKSPLAIDFVPDAHYDSHGNLRRSGGNSRGPHSIH